jgi:LPS export ABC transporter protein LptC
MTTDYGLLFDILKKMRGRSVKFMRRVLIGIVALTLGALLVNYLQGLHRRSRQVVNPPKILAPEVKRSAKDIEYSEFQGDPRVLRFKIHANLLLETQEGDLLEGIEAYDFNPDGSVRNLIRSQKARYDPERKLADFFGDVRLSINKSTQLQTNSLHYDLNSGIGTSPDFLQFQSEQIHGTARGVRYDQKQQALALTSEVNLTLEQRWQQKKNDASQRELHATADRAYCSEIDNRVLLEGTARVDSDSQTLSGERIEALFDPDEKNIRSLTASGNAVYDSKMAEGTRVLGGDQLVFGLSRSGALERISLSGQAWFSSKSSAEEQDLRGSKIDVNFDAGEIPTQIEARTAVSFRMQREKEQTLVSGEQLEAKFAEGTRYLESLLVRKNPGAGNQARMSVKTANAAGSDLQADEIRIGLHESGGRSVLEKLRAEGSTKYVSSLAAGRRAEVEPLRSMRASLLELTQSGTGDFIESGSATGNVVISEEWESGPTSAQVRRLSADRAHFTFFPEGNALKNLDAEGRVRVAYEKKGKAKASPLEKFNTASDNISAVCDLVSGRSVVRSVVQWGKFTYEDGARSASAGRCEYRAGKAIVTLSESPKISDETKTTSGDRMEYDQNRKVLWVSGRVRSVLNPGGRKESFLGSTSSSSPGIVKADEMRYWTETGRVLYSVNVHALSENQDLTTDELEITDGLNQLSARGAVRHLLSKKDQGNSSKGLQPAADLLTEVESTAMTYSKAKNQISYSGNVALHSRDLDLKADNLDAVPANDERSLKQATASGKVVLHMGARVCKGGNAEYYADSGRVIVTGHPAEVIDPSRGRSTARRLTYSTSDDTILLEE